MHRVRVKIEGLRDPATALRVAELGADAIGLVFAESPRRVTAEQAREIVANVPPSVASVGVFVNASSDEINRAIDETGIQIVQLHGDEPPEIVAKVHAPCIKAFRVRDEVWIAEVENWLREMREIRDGHHFQPRKTVTVPRFPDCRRRVDCEPASGGAFVPPGLTVLLDAYDPAVRGGSGRRFNWDLIARSRAAGRMEGLGPIILAGGLDADCVAEAIRKVRPWAVDVASGVESAPGVKDLAKVRAFLEAVRAAGRP